MKDETNLRLFYDTDNIREDKLARKMCDFAKETLRPMITIIEQSYDYAHSSLSNMTNDEIRRISRSTRVAEQISKGCSAYFSTNYRDVNGKLMLHFPDICQFHILKMNKGKITPRKTRTAIDATHQTSLPFENCPQLYIGHDCQYGRTAINLLFYQEGQCKWSYSLREMFANEEEPQLFNINYNNKELIARPKSSKKQSQVV